MSEYSGDDDYLGYGGYGGYDDEDFDPEYAVEMGGFSVQDAQSYASFALGGYGGYGGSKMALGGYGGYFDEEDDEDGDDADDGGYWFGGAADASSYGASSYGSGALGLGGLGLGLGGYGGYGGYGEDGDDDAESIELGGVRGKARARARKPAARKPAAKKPAAKKTGISWLASVKEAKKTHPTLKDTNARKGAGATLSEKKLYRAAAAIHCAKYIKKHLTPPADMAKMCSTSAKPKASKSAPRRSVVKTPRRSVSRGGVEESDSVDSSD